LGRPPLRLQLTSSVGETYEEGEEEEEEEEEE